MEGTLTGQRTHGLIPGSLFGKYTILEHIGHGGMGDVYRAVQNGLDRVVALKVLPHFLARSIEFSDRFNAEALSISRLQHQNIVTLYDYGEVEGQKYIAMQFIQGTTLGRLIQREKPLDYPRIINFAKQIGRGLKYAHAGTIVHRDIKSGNIMVESGDKAYISDFGIAKAIDAPSITTTGMALGTPEFMAPEQCEGGAVDGQSDIYGLGVIIFEMVVGKPPFLADTPLAVAYKQVNEIPPLISKIRPDVPRRLELIVAKCLKKNKLERYRNADELLRDLDSVHLDLPPPIVEEEPDSPDNRITDRRSGSRRRDVAFELVSKPWLAIAAVVLAVVSLSLWGLQAWLTHGGTPKLTQLDPVSIMGPALIHETEGEMRSEEVLDGKRSTAFGIAPKTSATLELAFAKTILWTGAVFETGLTPAGQAVPLQAPKALILEADGGGTVRIVFRSGDQPQYHAIGLVGKKFHLTFEAQSTGAAAAVREMRCYGIPYE